MKRYFIRTAIIAAAILCSMPFTSEAQSLKTAKEYASIPVTTIKRVTIPRSYHEGLCLDGGNIWVMNGQGGKTWKIDPATGSVLAELSLTPSFTEGMTMMPDGTFYATDWDEKKLYRMRFEDNSIRTLSEVSVAPGMPAGVVWADSKIYTIVWTRGMGTKFELIELDENNNIIRRILIRRIQEPAHMTWDGRYLWITSWYSKMVYKVDLKTLEILGYFDSPVSMATGIAWDGKSFWITGTYGDLYQVELKNPPQSK